MNKLLLISAVPIALRAFLLPFAHYFRAKGWRVDAIANGVSTCPECVAACDRVWDVELGRSPLDPKNFLTAPSKIGEIVAQQQYDIVHAHMAVAGFVTRYALKDLRKQGKPKIIYTAHGFNFYKGEMPLKNAIFLTLEKLAGLWTDYLVVINREDEAAAKRYRIVPPDRVRYMPGIGVDIQRYNPDAISASEVEQVRQELQLAPTTSLFLCIAEFTPRKRHRDLLTAFAKVARDNTCLAFAGEGVLQAEMQQLSHQLGVKDRVRFLGFRRDIPTLSRAAVATILVSESEGLPRSIMESLCLETPAIGTDIRGIRELLDPGCGILVPVGNVEAIAKAIAWILDHPEDATMMGKRGRELIADYDLRQILNLHETLYAETLVSAPSFASSESLIMGNR